MRIPNTAILAVHADHPTMGRMQYELARQDRRLYYRLLLNGRGTGSLTTEKGATETIAHWRTKGWIQ